MTTRLNGELEIDHDRGVIYFHCYDFDTVDRMGTVTPLRICGLPKPIPKDAALWAACAKSTPLGRLPNDP